MSNNISTDNTFLAIVILVLFCVGEPDLLDMLIKLFNSMANWFDRIPY